MFRKTIAVGPFDPTEFWVTGGLCAVARHLAGCATLLGKISDDAGDLDINLDSFVADCRVPAMVMAAPIN